jgi:hypothetical protein
MNDSRARKNPAVDVFSLRPFVFTLRLREKQFLAKAQSEDAKTQRKT